MSDSIQLSLAPFRSYYLSVSMYRIVQIGAGGNGGYVTQRLMKLLYAMKEKDPDFKVQYTIIDGDIVEPKNLLRQPFLPEDLYLHKSEVLASRYESAYDIPVFFQTEYVTTKEQIKHAFYMPSGMLDRSCNILLGCVDNHATRKIMHEVFEEMYQLVYLDVGIDGIDEEESRTSGYSGQVVCGVKEKGKTVLEPVAGVYPDILTDTESFFPQDACAATMVSSPQRMQTNEMAALVMVGYLNTLLASKEVVSHYTNFNARNQMMKPIYVTPEQIAYANEVVKA